MATLDPANHKELTRRENLTEIFANISMGWKITLMVLVLSLGMAGISVSAYVGLQSLKYQLSNIYDFMLVPIVAIDHADSALADAQNEIFLSHDIGLSASERAQSAAKIASNNQVALDAINRYDKEWVTTTSPEFTQSLRDSGKLDLQKQEVIALNDLHAAFNTYQIVLDKYLASVNAGYPNAKLAQDVTNALQTAREKLEKLIDINNQYAEISNELALTAYQNAFRAGASALAIGLILGLFISYLIGASITSRLNELTKSATAMQEGDLKQTVSIVGRDEVARLGRAFNNMATELSELFGTMEQRVADRAKALTTSAEVSRRLALVTNTRQLAKEVVEQVQSAFHYYHAHIYFVDAESKDLVMAGGTGEAGATMLARGHKIPNGRGLVGRAARTNTSSLVPDVTKEEGWLPNPLLPETRAEAAVPIAIGNQVLGVLDVQQNVVNGLGEDDLNLLQSLAGQVAITLQNARTFEETTAKAKREELINTIGEKIQRAATVEDTLKIAIRALGSATGAQRVSASIQAKTQNPD